MKEKESVVTAENYNKVYEAYKLYSKTLIDFVRDADPDNFCYIKKPRFIIGMTEQFIDKELKEYEIK